MKKFLFGRLFFGPTDPSDPSRPFHDVDGDGFNDASGWATQENLRATLTSDFATSAGRLLILMLDHGYRTQDFAAFRLNENQVLPSTTLKGWLDDLQTSPVARSSGSGLSLRFSDDRFPNAKR